MTDWDALVEEIGAEAVALRNSAEMQRLFSVLIDRYARQIAHSQDDEAQARLRGVVLFRSEIERIAETFEEARKNV